MSTKKKITWSTIELYLARLVKKWKEMSKLRKFSLNDRFERWFGPSVINVTISSYIVVFFIKFDSFLLILIEIISWLASGHQWCYIILPKYKMANRFQAGVNSTKWPKCSLLSVDKKVEILTKSEGKKCKSTQKHIGRWMSSTFLSSICDKKHLFMYWSRTTNRQMFWRKYRRR